MFWRDVADGAGPTIVALTPTKTRGIGAGAYTSSEITVGTSSMVVLDGTGTVTLGYYDGAGTGANFVAFEDGLMLGTDTLVNHGQGVRLAASVTGASGLRIGFAGRSQ
jgi:hypothetical protein